jgi:Luciferase-like monooxygenase
VCADECVGHRARAEEFGCESGWTIEQTIGPTPVIAPLQMLAYAAACTERLRLGVGVLASRPGANGRIKPRNRPHCSSGVQRADFIGSTRSQVRLATLSPSPSDWFCAGLGAPADGLVWVAKQS